MTTFFQVFYTNQCFARYTGLYEGTRSMMSACYDVALDLRVHLGPSNRAHCRLALRYLICDTLLFFAEMDGTIDEMEWHELLSLELITPEEKELLIPCAPQEK